MIVHFRLPKSTEHVLISAIERNLYPCYMSIFNGDSEMYIYNTWNTLTFAYEKIQVNVYKEIGNVHLMQTFVRVT